VLSNSLPPGIQDGRVNIFDMIYISMIAYLLILHDGTVNGGLFAVDGHADGKALRNAGRTQFGGVIPGKDLFRRGLCRLFRRLLPHPLEFKDKAGFARILWNQSDVVTA